MERNEQKVSWQGIKNTAGSFVNKVLPKKQLDTTDLVQDAWLKLGGKSGLEVTLDQIQRLFEAEANNSLYLSELGERFPGYAERAKKLQRMRPLNSQSLMEEAIEWFTDQREKGRSGVEAGHRRTWTLMVGIETMPNWFAAKYWRKDLKWELRQEAIMGRRYLGSNSAILFLKAYQEHRELFTNPEAYYRKRYERNNSPH